MQPHGCLRSEWLISAASKYRQDPHLRYRPAAGSSRPVSTANGLPPPCDTFQITRARRRNASPAADRRVKLRPGHSKALSGSHPALLHKSHPKFSPPGGAETVRTAPLVGAALLLAPPRRACARLG